MVNFINKYLLFLAMAWIVLLVIGVVVMNWLELNVSFGMMHAMNIIAMPVFLVYIVSRFQRITTKDRKAFAFKTWLLFSLLCIALSVVSLVTHRDPTSIILAWWPGTGIVFAPMSAGIIVVLIQAAILTKRGEGFAWKSWVIASVAIFAVQSVLIGLSP
ncbi:MAG: hypothetical protein SGI88_20690 [Candidatus Hydrogenedentes bacterium]|nr:hypothetical protein [Candidatus Hydrogenedentota bacterium]